MFEEGRCNRKSSHRLLSISFDAMGIGKDQYKMLLPFFSVLSRVNGIPISGRICGRAEKYSYIHILYRYNICFIRILRSISLKYRHTLQQ